MHLVVRENSGGDNDTDGESEGDYSGRADGPGTGTRYVFHVQCYRVPSTQPRLLDVSARDLPGSASPGGPCAKTPPTTLQTALLVLDSDSELEKVVLALRAAEEGAARERALELAVRRRRDEEQRVMGKNAIALLLGQHGRRGGDLSSTMGVLPEIEPLVVDWAR